jgi:hypothetical protein
LVFSAPQRRRWLSLIPPWLRFLSATIYARGWWQDGPGWPHHRAARPGGPAPPGGVPPAAPLDSSSWLILSSNNIWISGYFSRIVDLQRYGVLTVLFPAESWLRQQVLQWSSNM